MKFSSDNLSPTHHKKIIEIRPVGIAISVVMALSAASVSAWCNAPSTMWIPMTPVAPNKPYVPICINEYTRTHTCSDWEIASYNNDVENYNWELEQYERDVDAYIDALNEYLYEAREYAECMVDELN
ncbi:MAG: hypothetical protein OXI87_21045 [Albidovulum sp.]|nr:hypothetical protein [Albidovulum sp.]